MGIYRGIDGVTRETQKIYRGISGVNRETKEVWRGIDGVNRKVFVGSVIYTVTGNDDAPFYNVTAYIENQQLHFTADTTSLTAGAQLILTFQSPLTFGGQGTKDISASYEYFGPSGRAIKMQCISADNTTDIKYTGDGYAGWTAGTAEFTFPARITCPVLQLALINNVSTGASNSLRMADGGLMLYPAEYPQGILVSFNAGPGKINFDDLNYTIEYNG